MKILKRLTCLLLVLSLTALPVAAEGLLIMPAPEKTDSWGLTMTLEDVTSTSATIVLTQSGGDYAVEMSTGYTYLMTGADYWLEVWRSEKWEPMEIILDNLAWISIGYGIPAGESREWTANLGSIYGELPAGDYRIGKSVSLNNRNSTDRETKTYYAEFTITPEDTNAWANPFSDIKRNDWFYEAVAFAYQNGLMQGKSDTAFAPYGVTTRGQIVVMLWRLEDCPVVNYLLPFSDVDQEAYYSEAIRWAAAEKLVTGYDDSTFRPNAPISRQQLAAILWRYAQQEGMDVSVGEDTNILSYNDAFDISEYAIPAIQWACGAGVMSGYEDGSLNPHGQAVRAHTAKMLMNFLKI